MVLGAAKEGTSCGVGSCSSTATTTDFVLSRTKTCLVRTLLCLGLALCFQYVIVYCIIWRREITLPSTSLGLTHRGGCPPAWTHHSSGVVSSNSNSVPCGSIHLIAI
jgi:hypothetical protein